MICPQLVNVTSGDHRPLSATVSTEVAFAIPASVVRSVTNVLVVISDPLPVVPRVENVSKIGTELLGI